MNFTKIALQRSVSVVMILLAIVVFGITSIPKFDMELTPDIELPMLLVYTVYPGAEPEAVDELVTREIEAAGEALSGIDSVQSYSWEGGSQVLFSYNYGVTISECYDDLRAALDAASGSLPEDAMDPMIIEMNMDSQAAMTVSITANGDIDLLSAVNTDIVPELERVTGIADVTVYGGTEDYIQILLKEELLKQYGLTMSSLSSVVAASNFSMPAGTVEAGSQDVSISVGMDYNTVQKLRNLPITTSTGSTILLSDVAEINYNTRAADSISRYNGHDSITVSIQKKQSSATVNVANDVKNVLNRLQAENNAVRIEVGYDSSEAIVSSLTAVGQTLVLGVVFAMLVLFIFFGDFKASLIVGSSMPVSLFVTLIAMNFAGFSLNLITMAALVIAIGMMVDSSIVVIESCFRVKDEGGSFYDAALKGTKTVTLSIIASTITTIVVYAPLATMKGLTGQLFQELGFTIIFAMLSSLLSAMTLVPLFYYKFKPVAKKELKINKGLHFITRVYRKILKKLLHKKLLVILVTIGMMVLSLFLATKLNVELMPASDEGVVSISVSFRSGTKLGYMDEQIQVLEDMVANDADVEDYTVSISESSASISANLKKDRSLSTVQMVDKWVEATKDYTNMDISIQSSGSSMSGMMSTNVAQIDIEGYDLDVIKEAANEIQEVMKTVQGVTRTSSSVASASTKAQIEIDSLAAMNFGLTPAQVAGNVNNILSGTKADTVTYQGDEFAIWLEYPEGLYDDLNSLMNVTLSSPTGKNVPLRDIAKMVYTDAPEMIFRADGKYQVSVTGMTTDAAKYSAPAEVEAKVGQMILPEGVSLATTSMNEMMGEEFGSLFTALWTAIFLIFLVMAMQFESPRFSLMVMMCIPFSLIGSFMLMFVAGTTLSMISLMGFLMLVGIVVNNGILLVDTTNQMRESRPLEEALIEAGCIRIRPIFMTTLTTILAMVPMSLGIGDNGEMQQGMAMVIIGGLIASTLLSLILLPTIYLLIYKKDKSEKKREKAARKKQKQDKKENALYEKRMHKALTSGEEDKGKPKRKRKLKEDRPASQTELLHEMEEIQEAEEIETLQEVSEIEETKAVQEVSEIEETKTLQETKETGEVETPQETNEIEEKNNQ